MKKESTCSNIVSSDEREDTDEDDIDTHDIKTLATSGTLIAVRALDHEYEYVILQAKTSAYTLREPSTDKWGVIYNSGAEVYFDRIEKSPLRMRLLKRLPCLVPSNSVLYILSEVDIELDGTIQISDSLHRRILSNI